MSDAETPDAESSDAETSDAGTRREVELRRVAGDLLEQLVGAALGDAAAGEVTPPVTPGDEWTAERAEWLRTFHRTRSPDLAGDDAEMTWAVVADGQVVGAIRLKRIGGSRSAEVGLWLTRSVRGRGVGRSAVAAVLENAADRGMTAVRADTTAGNHRALALLAALGFEPTSVDGDAVIAWRALSDAAG